MKIAILGGTGIRQSIVEALKDSVEIIDHSGDSLVLPQRFPTGSWVTKRITGAARIKRNAKQRRHRKG